MRLFSQMKLVLILVDYDAKSEKKLDKDRFRKDLGNLIQAYKEVASRLGILYEESNIREVNFKKPKAVKLKKNK